MNEWEWRLLEDRPAVERLPIPGGDARRGSRVLLRPRAQGSDAFDALLAGRIATVEAIEQDYEGKCHIAVVLDDDPGRDLGFMRQPGHRFFYGPDELEAHPDAAGVDGDRAAGPAATSVLIAGIGNIFMGDDGFGVEVAQRLLTRALPPGVRAIDYGIRSLDLAYALIDMQIAGTTILVDACSRGAAPGTLFVIEPDVSGQAAAANAGDAHSMTPEHVIALARTTGGTPGKLLLIGCEPATFGPEEGHLGLSEPVAASIDEAIELALTLAGQVQAGEWPEAAA